MDETFSELDEVLFRVHAAVARGSFFTISAEGVAGWPPRAYTIGLHDLGHPELVVVGLGEASAHALLLRAHEDVLAGKPLLGGRRRRRRWPFGDGTLTCGTVDVPERQWRRTVPLALDYYRARGWPSRPGVRQLVWPDGVGVLPWQRAAHPDARRRQVLLDEIVWDPPCPPDCDWEEGDADVA